MRLSDDVDTPVNPLPREGVFAEGNMENISATIPINIFVKPNVVENIYIGANCSPEEIAIYTALFKESVISLPGHMRRCQALIHLLLNMRSQPILMLSQFGKNYAP